MSSTLLQLFEGCRRPCLHDGFDDEANFVGVVGLLASCAHGDVAVLVQHFRNFVQVFVLLLDDLRIFVEEEVLVKRVVVLSDGAQQGVSLFTDILRSLDPWGKYRIYY